VSLIVLLQNDETNSAGKRNATTVKSQHPGLELYFDLF